MQKWPHIETKLYSHFSKTVMSQRGVYWHALRRYLASKRLVLSCNLQIYKNQPSSKSQPSTLARNPCRSRARSFTSQPLVEAQRSMLLSPRLALRYSRPLSWWVQRTLTSLAHRSRPQLWGRPPNNLRCHLATRLLGLNRRWSSSRLSPFRIHPGLNWRDRSRYSHAKSATRSSRLRWRTRLSRWLEAVSSSRGMWWIRRRRARAGTTLTCQKTDVWRHLIFVNWLSSSGRIQTILKSKNSTSRRSSTSTGSSLLWTPMPRSRSLRGLSCTPRVALIRRISVTTPICLACRTCLVTQGTANLLPRPTRSSSLASHLAKWRSWASRPPKPAPTSTYTTTRSKCSASCWRHLSRSSRRDLAASTNKSKLTMWSLKRRRSTAKWRSNRRLLQPRCFHRLEPSWNHSHLQSDSAGIWDPLKTRPLARSYSPGYLTKVWIVPITARSIRQGLCRQD